MTLEQKLKEVQKRADTPKIEGFEAQREMVAELHKWGLLQEPEPLHVAQGGLPQGQVRVRWRCQ